MDKFSRFGFGVLVYCLALFQLLLVHANNPLSVGFYDSTCPAAEAIVRRAVLKAVSKDPGVAGALIRLHFHDCFVRGCDGSVLLDSTPGNKAEKEAFPNLSLRGFEIIGKAKAMLEAKCPHTVSCSDILAFAARDSTRKTGSIDYAVQAGRRDGRISRSAEAERDLPPPFFTVQQLEQNFARKGLSLDDMVTLSGAHSIGVAFCFVFSNRLYSFNATHPQDPSMDQAFASYLKTRCPAPGSNVDSPNLTADLDSLTPYYLDNKYYKGLIHGRGLLATDQILMSNASTANMVRSNAKHPSHWAAKFAAAMARMGAIDVLTGNDGEIREKCSVVNRP